MEKSFAAPIIPIVFKLQSTTLEQATKRVLVQSVITSLFMKVFDSYSLRILKLFEQQTYKNIAILPDSIAKLHEVVSKRRQYPSIKARTEWAIHKNLWRSKSIAHL